MGVVLWEVCSGRRWAPDLPAEPLLAWAAAGPAPPSALPSRELDAVVRRATAPRPQDRYPDAAALLADLLAWRQGQRVSAYAYSPAEELVRLVNHFRWPLGGLALALVTGVAVGLLGYVQVVRERDGALRAERVAESANQRLMLERAHEAAQRGDAVAALAWSAAVLDRSPGHPAALGLQARLRAAIPLTLLGPSPLPPDCVDLQGRAGDAVCVRGDEVVVAAGDAIRWRAPVGGRRALRDDEGRWVGVVSVAEVVVLDGATGAEVVRVPGRGLAIAADHLAIGEGEWVRLHALPGGEERWRTPAGSQVGGGWFAPDGRLRTWHADGQLVDWDGEGRSTFVARLEGGAWHAVRTPGAVVYVPQSGGVGVWTEGAAPVALPLAGFQLHVAPFADGVVVREADHLSHWEPPWTRPSWDLPLPTARPRGDALVVPGLGGAWEVAVSGGPPRPLRDRAEVACDAVGAEVVCVGGAFLETVDAEGGRGTLALDGHPSSPVFGPRTVLGLYKSDLVSWSRADGSRTVLWPSVAARMIDAHPEGVWVFDKGGRLSIGRVAPGTLAEVGTFPRCARLEGLGRRAALSCDDGWRLVDDGGRVLEHREWTGRVHVEPDTGARAVVEGATTRIFGADGAWVTTVPVAATRWLGPGLLLGRTASDWRVVEVDTGRAFVAADSRWPIQDVARLPHPDGRPTRWVVVVDGRGAVELLDLDVLGAPPTEGWSESIRRRTGLVARAGSLVFDPSG